ncbi:MAG: hypothetical protein HYV07_11935 [Deltaproteobacteria bacterium]|nr:hypothetical protein [Deltaproteobacteria bacterium]
MIIALVVHVARRPMPRRTPLLQTPSSQGAIRAEIVRGEPILFDLAAPPRPRRGAQEGPTRRLPLESPAAAELAPRGEDIFVRAKHGRARGAIKKTSEWLMKAMQNAPARSRPNQTSAGAPGNAWTGLVEPKPRRPRNGARRADAHLPAGRLRSDPVPTGSAARMRVGALDAIEEWFGRTCFNLELPSSRSARERVDLSIPVMAASGLTIAFSIVVILTT